MRIEDVRWLDAEQTTLSAAIDGVRMNIPADSDNRHFQALLVWVNEGGFIAPFEATL